MSGQPPLALIPDKFGNLLKFYETYIKLWLLNFIVYVLESLGELGKKTVFLKTYSTPLVMLSSLGSAQESAFNSHPRDLRQ